MKMLRIGKAVLYMKVKPEECLEDAINRFLQVLTDAEIEISFWEEETIEEVDD